MPGLKPAAKPFVLTGADQRYSRALAQLLLSAERHGAQKRYRWIAFDLGIEAATLAWLKARFDWCDWQHVPFASLPPHYRVETRSFAWKPWAIWQVMEHADAPVLWMDSATILKSDLTEVFDWIAAHGVYAAYGQSAMRHRCEPSVMYALGFPQELAETPEVVANLVGFDPGNTRASKVAQNWERHAQTPGLLLPKTVTVDRHMNDQAVLGCLLLPLVASGRLRLSGDQADICSGTPYTAVSTRNKLPPWLPLWADPLARLWYWTYKTIDQALWRRKQRKRQ